MITKEEFQKKLSEMEGQGADQIMFIIAQYQMLAMIELRDVMIATNETLNSIQHFLDDIPRDVNNKIKVKLTFK